MGGWSLGRVPQPVILGDARDPDMQKEMNLKIKFRKFVRLRRRF